jgi:hypothetical protein
MGPDVGGVGNILTSKEMLTHTVTGNSGDNQNPEQQRLPLVLELVGPAGVGKSSVATALQKCGGGAFIQPQASKALSSFRFARGAVEVAVPFASQFSRIPSRPWYRFAIMAQLRGYQQMMRKWEGQQAVLVLDQGPVYLMSILQRALARDGSDSESFIRYWNETLQYWADRLSLIVNMQASDELLFKRIQSRGTPHPLLGKGKNSAAPFFRRGDESRSSIFALLQQRSRSLNMMTISVGQKTIEEMAKDICASASQTLARASVRSV